MMHEIHPRGTVRRRYAILAEGMLLDQSLGKTAHGVLRYSDDDVVAVIDSTCRAANVTDILRGVRRSVPIVSNFEDALRFAPTSLLIGSAPIGGALPAPFRSVIATAIEAGLEIVSGLHELLTDDGEFVRIARERNGRLWDVRIPPADLPVFSGSAYDVPQVVILAVGSDCAVGKMSVMLELRAAARAVHDRAAFVATGQTGILIEGSGIAVDRVISDFVAGATEQMVVAVPDDVEFTLVEGQGAILHPAYAAVTFGLLFGSAPDALILCHRVGQTTLNGYPQQIPSLERLIAAHEEILADVKPAKCIAVALNTVALDDAEARRVVATTEERLGLPTDDVVRFGGERLWSAVASTGRTTEKWGRDGQGRRGGLQAKS